MQPNVTKLLSALQSGDRLAARELLPIVYDELRQLAAAKLHQELPGQTLQPTALVHEAYLRLVGTDDSREWDGRGHFFAAAAEAMRRILIDQARRKSSEKHGGNRQREELADVTAPADADQLDLLALDEALNRLAESDSLAADLVKLRYFAGLTTDQAAAALNIAPRTAYYTWAYAKAWLHRAIAGRDTTEPTLPVTPHKG